MGAALDRVGEAIVDAMPPDASRECDVPAGDLARAALDCIRQLDNETAGNVWKRLKIDPCKHGVRPDDATRALLDALFDEPCGVG